MRIRSGRVELELHELARRRGPTLLLLHALFGCSNDWGEVAATWPGSAFALDFAGHGGSQWIAGGAYTPEILASDVDAVLAATGAAALAGAGLGAYVGLLVAGSRRALVPAALLIPGPGLCGGGAQPRFGQAFPDPSVPVAGEPAVPAYDLMVRWLDRDIRPVDYTQQFATAAQRLLLLEDGGPRPPWWEAARSSPSAERVEHDLPAALRRLAQTGTAAP